MAKKGNVRLWSEAIALYGLAPVAMAVLLPPGWLFPALFVLTGVGLWLLHRTPGFRWQELTDGFARIDWTFVALFGFATMVVCLSVMLVTRPDALFFLVRRDPALMAMIAVLYPVLSALPQELVYRPLFFRRYSALLPADPRVQVVLNAGVFALAHLMYWSWIVAAMTFAGGLAFAWSYRLRGNFPQAVLLHGIAGIIVFAVGLGVYFYSGNVRRPF